MKSIRNVSDKALQILAVIPARGGSKSVPLKNIRPLGGRPLLAYAIASACQAPSVSRLIVSTDNERIAGVARECGAEVAIRPAELATDQSPTEGALLHVLDHLKAQEGYEPDVVLTLEPTSPFRSAQLIERCIDLFRKTDADSAIGVLETHSNYGKVVEGKFEFLFPGQPRRRQERPPLYMECSTIYATRTGVLRARRSVLGEKLYAVIVPPEEAVDINDPIDFEIAEARMSSRPAIAEEPSHD